MSWYYNYKRTIETDEGIKAKSKRGAFVKNWWADRWIEAMERLMDRNRLQRGRRYARKGQVLFVDVEPGRVTAEVQGSRRTPYKVAIELRPLSDANWEKVAEALAERPLFVAQLLAGEMPQEIEEAFAAVNLSLFPGRGALAQDCSCPDWASVCKHLAAVHYILAERLDEDPFLLFQLRGRTQDEILATLGREPGDLDEATVPAYAPASPLADALDTFWQAGPEMEAFSAQITRPETPYPVLERLGAPDFLPDARRWLEKAYDAAAETAVMVAFEDETGTTDEIDADEEEKEGAKGT